MLASFRVNGLAYMIVAMMLLPFMDALSKSLAVDYPAEQITWVRNLVHTLVLLPVVLYRYGLRGLVPGAVKLHLIRGVCFIVATALYVVALGYMPFADAVSLIFLFPFLVVAGSGFFLGERVGPVRWTAVVFGFIGILLIARPGFVAMNPGVPFALAAAVLTAVYILLTRRMAGTSPTSVMLLMPALIGTIMFAFIVPFRWQALATVDALQMGAIGLLAAFVHLLIILAYQKAEASLVVSLTYSQIVVSSILGYTIFDEFPDSVTWCGIAIIIGSGVLIAWREGRSRTLNARS